MWALELTSFLQPQPGPLSRPTPSLLLENTCSFLTRLSGGMFSPARTAIQLSANLPCASSNRLLQLSLILLFSQPLLHFRQAGLAQHFTMRFSLQLCFFSPGDNFLESPIHHLQNANIGRAVARMRLDRARALPPRRCSVLVWPSLLPKDHVTFLLYLPLNLTA